MPLILLLVGAEDAATTAKLPTVAVAVAHSRSNHTGDTEDGRRGLVRIGLLDKHRWPLQNEEHRRDINVLFYAWLAVVGRQRGIRESLRYLQSAVDRVGWAVRRDL